MMTEKLETPENLTSVLLATGQFELAQVVPLRDVLPEVHIYEHARGSSSLTAEEEASILFIRQRAVAGFCQSAFTAVEQLQDIDPRFILLVIFLNARAARDRDKELGEERLCTRLAELPDRFEAGRSYCAAKISGYDTLMRENADHETSFQRYRHQHDSWELVMAKFTPPAAQLPAGEV